MSEMSAEARSTFESRTVWMLGSPRSGSTWLLSLLAQHPLVVPMNEPTLGYHLSPFLMNEPGYRASDLEFKNFALRKVVEHDPAKFFAAAYEDVWVPGLRRLIGDRLQAYVERFPHSAPVDEAILVVKEPNGSQAADVIMRAQPDSSLLFLLRDGRDVVDSELASFEVGGWLERAFPHMQGVTDEERLAFVEYSAYAWLWRTESVETAWEGHEGPKLLVRYEDLLRAPEEHFVRVLEWLGSPLDGEAVRNAVDRLAFDQIKNRGPAQFNRSASPGAWRQNLRPAERELVERVLGPKLRELDYS